jgi:hypothetical protein
MRVDGHVQLAGRSIPQQGVCRPGDVDAGGAMGYNVGAD